MRTEDDFRRTLGRPSEIAIAATDSIEWTAAEARVAKHAALVLEGRETALFEIQMRDAATYVATAESLKGRANASLDVLRGAPRSPENEARGLLRMMDEAARTAQEAASRAMAALDIDTTDDLQALDRQHQVVGRAIRQALDGEALASRLYTACLAALPGNDFGTPFVLRITKQSPLEVMVVVAGAIGGLAAVWDKLLDIEVKLRTRDVRIQAARAKLEHEIAQSKHATAACTELRDAFAGTESAAELPIEEVAIYDNLDDAHADAL
jgi:hypothetical protein